MIDNNLILLILVGVAVGAAAGYLGSLMILKHMSLVGDALSHVALPGIAIAIMIHASPMLGAFVALTLAVLGVWYFQKNSHQSLESLVGIFFTASLAIGILITPEPDLLEALFGNIDRVTNTEGVIAIALSVLVIICTILITKKILLSIISEELSKSLDASVNIINLVYLLLVGLVVALGVKFAGTLLTGALVIIPAVSAKNISSNSQQYFTLSLLFGAVSAGIGVVLAHNLHFQSGPIVVLTSLVIFLASYTFKYGH